MQFPTPLSPGRLVRRYKRFLADVTLNETGEIVTAHCPNSGSMLGLCEPGLPVWLSRSAAKNRKLPHTLELIEVDGGLVGVNTMLPNHLVAEAVASGQIPELAGYDSLRREVRYGTNSRIDLLLEHPGRPPCYLEVKNVHLRRPGLWNGHAAEFPDCVTTRGAKHVRELAAVCALGMRAVMLFLVQRADCDHFRPADDLDPGYGVALRAGAVAGVETLAYACGVSPTGIAVRNALPVRLDAGAQTAA